MSIKKDLDYTLKAMKYYIRENSEGLKSQRPVYKPRSLTWA